MHRSYKKTLLLIYSVFIFLGLHKELYICNSTGLLIAGRINMRVLIGCSGNRNQVLNFQHSPSSNCKLTSSVIFNNTTRYVGSCCPEKLVLIPVHIKGGSIKIDQQKCTLKHKMSRIICIFIITTIIILKIKIKT